ncbi:MAG: hypothetical protein FWC60_02390 [Firmicutes bacterium]|nr:hypothetical protein [Bacillota bacterium]
MSQICPNTNIACAYGLEMHLKAWADRSTEAGILYGIWLNHKELLSIRLEPMPPMFHPYSDHSAAHSQTIVHTINRLLGPKRIAMLGATDTWLLLECAYRHDLGMKVSNDEKKQYVTSRDYDKFINLVRQSLDYAKDEREAAQKLRDMLGPLPEDTIANRTAKLIDYGKYLDLVLSLYYRKYHAGRSEQLINSERRREIPDDNIPDRLWNNIGKICNGHTQPPKWVLENLEHFEQGYCQDICHPRFVQTLLCLGDLLDLDNNRFNVFQQALWGGRLPQSSQAHLLKHKAVQHLYIDSNKIEVVADLYMEDQSPEIMFGYLMTEAKGKYKQNAYQFSEQHKQATAEKILRTLNEAKPLVEPRVLMDWEEQRQIYDRQAHLQHDACRKCADWFKMLREELDFLALRWSQIAPVGMPGSAPQLTLCKIFWQGAEMDEDTINLRYSIGHRRAAGIIQGTGLYGDISTHPVYVDFAMQTIDKELVFIRELVQNAMDANKIQLFRFLREGRYGDAVIFFGNDMTKWDPVIVLGRIDDVIRNLKVEVRVYYKMPLDYGDIEDRPSGLPEFKPYLRFEVRDVGTGIDGHTLKNMSKIGETRDKELQAEIDKMPAWLRPNGSFGIGMQSVFGVVDEFKALSGSRLDHKLRDLFFNGAKSSGELFAAVRESDRHAIIKYGTRVFVELKNERAKNVIDRLCPKGNPLVFNCDLLFQEIRRRIVQMLGRDLLPITLRFYVNDVEVQKYREPSEEGTRGKLNSVFEPLLQAAKLLPYGAYDKNLRIVDYDATEQLLVLNGKDEESLRIVHYDAAKQLVVDMELADMFSPHSAGAETGIGKTLDEREGGESSLRPIDFYYRGMRVPGVYIYRRMLYPCWDIKAYGYFSEAERVVAISRNQLLPHVEHGIYRKVAAAADNALETVWKCLARGDSFILTPGRRNALALSLLYHQVSCALGGQNREPYHALLSGLLKNTDATIPVLEYQYGELFVARAKMAMVFAKGAHANWYVNPGQMPYTSSPGCLVDELFDDKGPELIVQDIFARYLFSRGFRSSVAEVTAITRAVQEGELDLVSVYRYTEDIKDAAKCSKQVYRKLIENTVKQAHSWMGDSEKGLWFPVLLPVEQFAGLTVPSLKVRDLTQDGFNVEHRYVQLFHGNCFVSPFTNGEIVRLMSLFAASLTKAKEENLPAYYSQEMIEEFIKGQMQTIEKGKDLGRLAEFVADVHKANWPDLSAKQIYHVYYDRYKVVAKKLLEDILKIGHEMELPV